MGKSAIEWTERTWNPTRGCSIVSPGCHNCYAMRQAHRMNAPGKPYEGLTKPGPHGPVWTGRVTLDFGKLKEPQRRRKPTVYFVNSMSDLFHEKLSDDDILLVFDAMARAPQHTFQVLTKRASRMYLWDYHVGRHHFKNWPLPNVWLGISAEDQQRMDERWKWLAQTSAAVRFASLEPLLGPVNLRSVDDRSSLDPESAAWYDALTGVTYGEGYGFAGLGGGPRLDWVIVGGESGPGAREMDVCWVRDVVRQCRQAGTPCFVKQLGAKPFDSDLTELGENEALKLSDRKGGDQAEWPADLRVRQMPGFA